MEGPGDGQRFGSAAKTRPARGGLLASPGAYASCLGGSIRRWEAVSRCLHGRRESRTALDAKISPAALPVGKAEGWYRAVLQRTSGQFRRFSREPRPKNTSEFNAIAPVLQSIHSVQQSPGVQSPRKSPKLHVMDAHGTHRSELRGVWNPRPPRRSDKRLAMYERWGMKATPHQRLSRSGA